MAVLTTEAYDLSVRNQIAVERFKASTQKLIDPYLRNIDRYIRQRLSFSNISGYRRDQLENLLKSIAQFNTAQFKAFTKELQGEMVKFAQLESGFSVEALDAAIVGAYTAVKPTAAQLRQQINNR
ncbi:unnamed protein product, partial [marine sediment metagenome]